MKPTDDPPESADPALADVEQGAKPPGRNRGDAPAGARREIRTTVATMTNISTVIESLVSRVMSDTQPQRELHPNKKPTWAPPMVFPPELAEPLERRRTLWREEDYDPTFGRLWAVWTEPRRCGGKLVGFDLRAGKMHNGRVVTQLNPRPDGVWTVGPNWRTPDPVAPAQPLKSNEEVEQSFNEWSKRKKWNEYFKEYPAERDPMLARAIERERERFTEDQKRFANEQANYDRRQIGYQLNVSVRDMGLTCILNFCDAPDAVMQIGGRYAGICYCCGRILTDPTSRALGIGPECRGDRWLTSANSATRTSTRSTNGRSVQNCTQLSRSRSKKCAQARSCRNPSRWPNKWNCYYEEEGPGATSHCLCR